MPRIPVKIWLSGFTQTCSLCAARHHSQGKPRVWAPAWTNLVVWEKEVDKEEKQILNPASLSLPEKQLSPLWPGLAQATSSPSLGFLGKSCLLYCVIFLPTGPIPDLFQKNLAISFSSPFGLPLCSGAARGVMRGCWVTFADTLLTGTESHNDFLRWNFPLIRVCLCLGMCCFLFFFGFRVMSQLYKLHHHHPDMNSSYPHSGQPCCSRLRLGLRSF